VFLVTRVASPACMDWCYGCCHFSALLLYAYITYCKALCIVTGRYFPDVFAIAPNGQGHNGQGTYWESAEVGINTPAVPVVV
jgi:hypothetical protein